MQARALTDPVIQLGHSLPSPLYTHKLIFQNNTYRNSTSCQTLQNGNKNPFDGGAQSWYIISATVCALSGYILKTYTELSTDIQTEWEHILSTPLQACFEK